MKATALKPNSNFSYTYTSIQFNLDLLLSASRTKYLLLPHSSRLLRKLINLFYIGRARVDFELPSISYLPKDFIRLDPWELEALYAIAKSIKGNIVEIGRFNGGSTAVLCSANQTSDIYSIDIDPKDDNLLKGIFNTLKIGDRVHLIKQDSNQYSETFKHQINLLFIDGDHSYNGCINDLQSWWPKVSIGGYIVLHDCYLGSEVQSAVVNFLSDKKYDIIYSPFIQRNHYKVSSGSLCCVIKR